MIVVQGRRIFAAWVWALPALSVLALVPGESDAQAASLQPHPGIRLDGDADFCDDEDNDTFIGLDDGIVNCGFADGTRERPYVIEGWRISVGDQPACLGGVSEALPSCQTNVNCGYENRPDLGYYYEGSLVLCQTTKHVVIRDVELNEGSPAFSSESSDANYTTCENSGLVSNETCVFTSANVVVWGSSNVTFEDVRITTPRLAAFVASSVDRNGTEWTAKNVVFRRATITAAQPDANPQLDRALAAAGLSTGSTARLVRVKNADLAVYDSVLDAGGRSDGIQVDADVDRQRGIVHSFVLRNSTIMGAQRAGVYVVGAEAVVEGNRFVDNGVAGSRVLTGENAAGVVAQNVILASLEYEVRSNTFEMTRSGVGGVGLETAAPGRISLNSFQRSPGVAGGTAVELFGGFQCNAQVLYNDFNDFFVHNAEPGCSLLANRNWWGDAEGPSSLPAQASGKVVVDDWLRAPLASLPHVAIHEPSAGEKAYGKIVLRGNATSKELGPVVRVEATRAEDDWRTPMFANGTEDWELPLDVTLEPRGARSIWLRACAEEDCGVPARLDLDVVDPPEAPLAILRAFPDLASVQQTVVLDASDSFSLQGFAIVAYRFSLGDGRELDWQPEGTVAAVYGEPGKFYPAVQVRDAAGLYSLNPAQAYVRVLDEEGSAKEAGAFAPAPVAVWSALAALAALVVARRRG